MEITDRVTEEEAERTIFVVEDGTSDYEDVVKSVPIIRRLLRERNALEAKLAEARKAFARELLDEYERTVLDGWTHSDGMEAVRDRIYEELEWREAGREWE